VDREARRAETRNRLLDAAAEVFTRLGFHAATVDDVAAEAGHTKGAVYSNFAGKEALFLALLDRHLDGQFAAMDRLLGMEATGDLLGALEDESTEASASGTGFGLLTMEFWLYAMRHPEVKAALGERYGRMRDRLAELIAERHAARGSVPRKPPAEAAALVLALDAGLFLQHLADPGAFPARLRAEAIVDLLDSEGRKHPIATRPSEA
jgi:AcrR family transcriptional regulator